MSCHRISYLSIVFVLGFNLPVQAADQPAPPKLPVSAPVSKPTTTQQPNTTGIDYQSYCKQHTC